MEHLTAKWSWQRPKGVKVRVNISWQLQWKFFMLQTIRHCSTPRRQLKRLISHICKQSCGNKINTGHLAVNHRQNQQDYMLHKL